VRYRPEDPPKVWDTLPGLIAGWKVVAKMREERRLTVEEYDWRLQEMRTRACSLGVGPAFLDVVAEKAPGPRTHHAHRKASHATQRNAHRQADTAQE